MKLKNKSVGAKVTIREVLVEISPKVKFKHLKRVSGVIVEKKDTYEQYYHTSTGAYNCANKQIIKNDCFRTFAVKMDNNVVDIEGNNIIIVREFDLIFNEMMPKTFIPVSYHEYLRAKKVIEKYEYQKTLL